MDTPLDISDSTAADDLLAAFDAGTSLSISASPDDLQRGRKRSRT